MLEALKQTLGNRDILVISYLVSRMFEISALWFYACSQSFVKALDRFSGDVILQINRGRLQSASAQQCYETSY